MPKNKSKEHLTYPLLPIRDTVVFPQMSAPFFIGRKYSVEALDVALATDRKIFAVTQRDHKKELPQRKDLFDVGVIGTIEQVIRLPNGTIKAIFGAQQRARIVNSEISERCYSATVELIEADYEIDLEWIALAKTVQTESNHYFKDIRKNTEGIEQLSLHNTPPDLLADKLAPLLGIEVHKKQELLEIEHPRMRLEKVFELMMEDIEIKRLERKLRERVQGQIGKTQKEYYLNEQLKAIHKELNLGEDSKAEISEYENKIKKLALSSEALEVANKELKKLKLMSPMSAEANVSRNYLDTLLGMPWGQYTKDNLDFRNAEKILDQDHYGLETVKERIIEYLAVAGKMGKTKGPILCLMGPPGVGKTSLARSIAKALGRKFERISLGGIRDEAEIRGHRRTYVGAFPGKIIQAIKKAKSQNPLILLDEVDKITSSQFGDPAAGLLEVLDPEQNDTFMDHYLEVEYDLSNVLFLCTANYTEGIPSALRDRMEVIQVPGYTEHEKENIAIRHLIKKQTTENGLSADNITIPKRTLQVIIQNYTRESGVRNLEREIGRICRKVAVKMVKNPSQSKVSVTKAGLAKFLGVPPYRHDTALSNNTIGVTTGMSWTPMGGELLFIEVSLMPGTGRVIITGQLGETMRESVRAAMSYVRSHSLQFGITPAQFVIHDAHVHFPEGAIKKDGPSAGIAIATSIVSAFTQIPVRRDIAMTGEITLQGKILPIGGLKEKLLAAKRGRITTAIIPKANQHSLTELPSELEKTLDIKLLDYFDEVLSQVLERPLIPIDSLKNNGLEAISASGSSY